MPMISYQIYTAAEREKLFTGLYKRVFPAVAAYVHKMGGSFSEAKDVFQDALIIYYEKAASDKLSVNTTEQAYLLGISKHLWLRKFNSDAHLTAIEGVDIANSTGEMDPSASKLMHYLETAGKKCMELLRSFYYDQTPLNEAAKLFGFSGVRSATVQKYKCLEKVRETIKKNSLSYADFID